MRQKLQHFDLDKTLATLGFKFQTTLRLVPRRVQALQLPQRFGHADVRGAFQGLDAAPLVILTQREQFRKLRKRQYAISTGKGVMSHFRQENAVVARSVKRFEKSQRFVQQRFGGSRAIKFAQVFSDADQGCAHRERPTERACCPQCALGPIQAGVPVVEGIKSLGNICIDAKVAIDLTCGFHAFERANETGDRYRKIPQAIRDGSRQRS